MKDVKGWEGLYAVTEDGNVWAYPKRGKKGGFMKIHLGYAGYPGVNFKCGNRVEPKRMHRLVAETFIPNPLNYSDVNHIDGDKTNNNVSNLEWCTRGENTKHEWKTGLSNHIGSGMHTKKYSGLWESKNNITYANIPRLKSKYRVGFASRGKKIMFGSYKTQKEAKAVVTKIKHLVLNGHTFEEIKKDRLFMR